MPSIYKTRVCFICGRAESKNWKRHWTSKHPGKMMDELSPGEVPVEPFDNDWIEAIKCEKTREVFRAATVPLPPI